MGTISEVTGDLFDPEHGFDAIGHGVNCFGVMHAGIADVFRKKNPQMFQKYAAMCNEKFLLPGMVMPYKTGGEANFYIYNIASQYRPGPDAKISYLTSGLQYVAFHMQHVGIKHLGLPRIGAGIGGLTYADVYDTVCEVFDGTPLDVTIVTL